MEKKWRTVIGPKSGLLDMDVKEIWKYRDLCLTFIRKNYITKYKQTVFGPFYMILSPLLTSGIFTVVSCVDTTQADKTHLEKCRRGIQDSERRMESRHILPAISSSSDTLAVS